MEYISDLHLHSKYSRATSKRNDISTLNEWAIKKGIKILGTGDFSHPKWLDDIKKELKQSEAHKGLYELKQTYRDGNHAYSSYFILTNEISTIYHKEDKQRKIHHCILAPNIEVVEQINDILSKHSNLEADGRPIIKISSPELVEILIGISDEIEVFPSHVWTPWYGVFGSKSGFDSMKDCYEDTVGHIHALETGLSSDPKMNWRWSELDKYTILSFSDAHSPENIGREAVVFDFETEELNYKNIIKAIRNKDKKHIIKTFEFYPEEGKYHYDGHRKCNICLKPKESLKYNNFCPVCHRKLTLGVEHRIEELSDRPDGFVPKNYIPFEKLIPLREIIAHVVKASKNSKKVMDKYNMLIKYFGNEYKTLYACYEDLIRVIDKDIAEAITDAKEGNITILPGYDGVYGKILIGKDKSDMINRNLLNKQPSQTSIDEFI